MPPRRPPRAPVKRVFEPLPKNSFWILNDAYDRRVWQQLRADSPSLRELEEKGAAFLPHFGSLLQDIFCLLFKYNINYVEERLVLASALLNEKFLRSIHQGAQYEFLREQTLLNEAHAGLSTLILGERLLALVREEKLLTRRDMRDLWDIQKQEEIVSQKIEEYENADTIPDDQMSEEGKKALAQAKQRMGGEVQGAEALLRQKTATLERGSGTDRCTGEKSSSGRSDQNRPRTRRRNRRDCNLGRYDRDRTENAAGAKARAWPAPRWQRETQKACPHGWANEIQRAGLAQESL